MSFNTNPNNNQQQEENFLKISLVNQGVFRRNRKKDCPLKHINDNDINYKNIVLLNKFISERGKILPSRVTSTSRKKQKAVSIAIKRARILALLSFTDKKEEAPKTRK